MTKTAEETKEKAAQIWAAMSESEKAGVQVTLFPAEPMAAAQAEGYDGHALVVALMDIPYTPMAQAKPRAKRMTKYEKLLAGI